MVIKFDRTVNLTDGHGRPFAGVAASGLTVDRAAAVIATLDLPAYVEVQWRLEPLAPVSLDGQQAAKLRRLARLAKACNRIVSRVQETPGFPHFYTALLAR